MPENTVRKIRYTYFFIFKTQLSYFSGIYNIISFSFFFFLTNYKKLFMNGRIDFVYHILNTYKFKGSIIINLLDI